MAQSLKFLKRKYKVIFNFLSLKLIIIEIQVIYLQKIKVQVLISSFL